MIRTKNDARFFLLAYEELSLPFASVWFRYDGKGEDEKEYTIQHETKGRIRATEDEAVSYIYRQRKNINVWLKDDGEHFASGTFRK